jgi:NtrC-family two-component system response regulator AlgB
VIAATNEDLHERVRERTFRADLLYRLDVAAVAMPSLAEMPAVIPELVRRMVTELSAELGRPEPPVSDEACAALARYAWPGNVRELRNAVERALVFHDGGELEIPVPSNPGDRAASFTMPFGITLEELERRYIEAMIAAEPHLDYVQLAPMLGISRKTLWEKRRRYRL